MRLALGNIAHGIAFVNNIKNKNDRIFLNIPITLNRYENPYEGYIQLNWNGLWVYYNN